MSSHHIIREKQEPALIFHDLNQLNYEYLGQLLEWSPTILVLEECLSEVLSLGIKIDYALVQKGNQSGLSAHEHQDHLKYIKAETVSLTEAVRSLVDEEYESVNIIGADIKLSDHAAISELKGLKDLSIIRGKERCILHRHDAYSKWYNEGEAIQIVSLYAKTTFSTTGFNDDLNNDIIDDQHKLVTQSNGLITIKTSGEPCFIIEML